MQGFNNTTTIKKWFITSIPETQFILFFSINYPQSSILKIAIITKSVLSRAESENTGVKLFVLHCWSEALGLLMIPRALPGEIPQEPRSTAEV